MNRLSIKRVFFFIFTFLSVVSASNLVSAEDIPSLFTQRVVSRAKALPPAPETGSIIVSIDFSLIKPSAQAKAMMKAPLPDKTIVFVKNRVESRGEDNYTWFGKVEGVELSTVVLTVVDGVMYGHVDMDGDTYNIKPTDGDYVVNKLDNKLMIPFDKGGAAPEVTGEVPQKKTVESPHAANYQAAQTTYDDGSQIDVLVLYTQQMKNTYGSSLSAKIQNYVDLANTAYANSGINTKIRLVYSGLYTDTNAAEGVGIHDALSYIEGKNNNYNPPATIQTLRDSYKADLVSLLRLHDTTSSLCGLAIEMTSQLISHSFEKFAFSVVEVKESASGQAYCSDLTFAHELGHNMGCDHDRDHTTSSGAYSYSYGYDVPGVFATVMSYDSPSITYFSTPLVTYNGYPIGKAEGASDSADNVRTINNTKVVVANFRGSSSGLSCNFSLSPTDKSFTTDGGWESLSVTASSDNCAWTATTDHSWIFFDSSYSGSGNGKVNYAVVANTAATSRTGTISIAGQTFTVTQDGVGGTNSNSPPTAPGLISPTNGQTSVAAAIVIFQWKKSTAPDGNSITYKLYYSTDPNFTGATPVSVASVKRLDSSFAAYGIGLVFSGILLIGGVRKKTSALVLILVVASIFASCGSGGGSGGNSPSNTNTAGELSSIAGGLTDGAKYYWKVVADDGKGGATSSDVWSFTTSSTGGGGLPSAPTGVTATAGNNQVIIGWSSVTGGTSYNIYRSTSSGVTKSSTKMASNATGTSYTDTTAANGNTYYYAVTAVNSSVESALSIEVSAKPSATNTVPLITKVDPTSGSVGTQVTITGTNFSSTLAGNTVKFNGVTASVISSTATQIVATVPTGATTGAITVTATGGTATSSTSYTVSTGGGNNTSTVTDINGNVYNTVTIGTQVWMKENLKVTKYRNGDSIPTTTSSSIPNDSLSKYQWAYTNNESNVATYGRLYTWYAATDSRGLCPTGWHLPTDAEWTTLTDYLGGESVAGGKMKETGTTHWISPNYGADNSSGFTALPGGASYHDGSFGNMGYHGIWWSAMESRATTAWYRDLGYDGSYVGRIDVNKNLGFSVRCVKD